MSVQSIIDVEINDEKLLKFMQLYKELQGQIKQMPAEWQAGAAAISDTTEELDALTAAYAARTELARKAREEDKKEAAEKAKQRETDLAKSKEEKEIAKEKAEIEKQAKADQADADKEAAEIERQRQKAEEDHQKKIDEFWTKKKQQAREFAKDFGLGLIGIGAGLFGLERLANSVSNQRVAAQGLGITTGEQKAFDVNFGTRLGLDSGFISHVQDVQSDLSQRWQFAPLGLQREAETEDHAQLSADVIKKAKQLWDQAGPQGHNTQWMQAHGLSGFMNFSQWQTIGAQTPEQINQYAEQYVRDSKKLATPDADQLAWQTLSEQLKRAGEQIENTLVRGLAPLAVPLAHLSDSVGKAIDTFLKTAPLKEWIDDLGHGLEWLAKYLGSKDFKDNIEKFGIEIKHIVVAIGNALSWIDGKIVGTGDPTPGAPGGTTQADGKETSWFTRMFPWLIPAAPKDGIAPPPGLTPWQLDHWTPSAQTPSDRPSGPKPSNPWWNPFGIFGSNDTRGALSPDEQKKLGTAGMDQLLNVVRQIESAGNNGAVGPMTASGTAKGPYQFTDDTWKQYGHGGSQFDPVASRQAAQEYLTDLETKYGGDVPKALAAYNWGPGNLDKDIAAHGADWLRYASPETQKYVHAAAQKIHVRVSTNVANQTGAQVAMSANAVLE